MPILNKQFLSLVISNCLRNSTVWHSMEQFAAEYQLITDDQILEQLTQVMIVARGKLYFLWPIIQPTVRSRQP